MSILSVLRIRTCLFVFTFLSPQVDSGLVDALQEETKILFKQNKKTLD